MKIFIKLALPVKAVVDKKNYDKHICKQRKVI